jgi:hypothetical protein
LPAPALAFLSDEHGPRPIDLLCNLGPGFINVDVSKEYGAHFDFGPVAVDLTQDFAGFTVGNAVGAGYARDGRG